MGDNKENQGGQQRRGRKERKRAQTIGHPANLNNTAYVLESQSMSVVPWFKRTPLPRNSPRLKWSINQATQQPTITRSESYACTLRWSRTPPLGSLPLPPAKWLEDKDDMGDSEEKEDSEEKDGAEEENEKGEVELENREFLALISSPNLSTPLNLLSEVYADSVSDSGYSQEDSREDCQDINCQEDGQSDCCCAESLPDDMAELHVSDKDGEVAESNLRRLLNIQSGDLAGHSGDLAGHSSDMAGHSRDMAGHSGDLAGHRSDLAVQSSDLSSQSCVMLQSILSALAKKVCEEIE